MGFFQNIRNLFRREQTLNGDDLLLQAIFGKTDINREEALEIPIVASCVDYVTSTFASVPIKLYRETITEEGKKVTKEVKDKRVALINDDTNDTLDGFQFKKAVCEDYLLGKGGFAYIKRVKNQVRGLYYVKDSNISIQKNTNSIFKNYTIMVDGQQYHDYEFLKLLRNTKDGASGKGLTDEISSALKTAFKRLKYEYDLTMTGGSRKGFIKSQKKLDKASIDALKKAWEDYYSGNANTVILNDGLEFQEASNNSTENEMNAKSQTFDAEIRELFHLGKDYNDFVKNAIMPILNAFVTALNRELLLEKEKEEYYFAYDTTELLKGSITERYNAYKIAIEAGFKTRNEVRYMENDNEINGLDIINLGLGSVLLDTKTGNIYTPNTDKMVESSTFSGDNLEKGNESGMQIGKLQ